MQAKDKMENQSRQSFDAIARIVAAYAGRSDTTQDEILALTHRLFPVFGDQPQRDFPTPTPEALSQRAEVIATPAEPAVAIETAVTDDKVFCLCCGRGFTMLKRHLKAEHGLTEDEYRTKFGLPEDFALVAPNYSERKAAYAKKVGLGKYARDAETQETNDGS